MAIDGLGVISRRAGEPAELEDIFIDEIIAHWEKKLIERLE